MARTGRPKAEISRKSCQIFLRPIYFRLFEKLERDFFTGRRVYGARNKHIDAALEEYFQKHFPELLAQEKKEGEAEE